jgi:FkbM family methyltransferase
VLTTVCEHTLFTRNLGPDSLVVDLGAHHGEFSEAMRRRFGATCHAIEAVPQFAERIAAGPGLHPHHMAVSDAEGTVPIHISSEGQASSLYPLAAEDQALRGEPVETIMVPAGTLEGFLEQEGISRIAVLKVDLEGAERELFRSTSDRTLLQADQIAIEFHDFMGLLDPAEVDQVRSRLEGLGFEGIRFSASNFDWLFVQPDRVPLSRVDVALARHVLRNVRGAWRRMRRYVPSGDAS